VLFLLKHAVFFVNVAETQTSNRLASYLLRAPNPDQEDMSLSPPTRGANCGRKVFSITYINRTFRINSKSAGLVGW